MSNMLLLLPLRTMSFGSNDLNGHFLVLIFTFRVEMFGSFIKIALDDRKLWCWCDDRTLIINACRFIYNHSHQIFLFSTSQGSTRIWATWAVFSTHFLIFFTDVNQNLNFYVVLMNLFHWNFRDDDSLRLFIRLWHCQHSGRNGSDIFFHSTSWNET